METLSITGQIFVKSFENCSGRLRKGQSIPVLAGTGLHGEGGAVRVIGVTEQHRTELNRKEQRNFIMLATEPRLMAHTLDR